jgi:hypothetical protein
MHIKDALNKIITYIEKSDQTKLVESELNFEKTHTINIQNHKILFRELSWKEGLEIDSAAFKKHNKNFYFSSEKEKREIVRKSIIKIYNIDDKEIEFNFEDLSYEFVEDYWLKYQNYLHLSSMEVNDIYLHAKKYFDPDNSEVFPLHPLIIEVDYMTKGIVSLSKKEFEELSIREFEAIQLILAVKNGG